MFIHHYLYQDLYLPLWTNIAASLVWGSIGFFIGKAFEKRSILRHEDMKKHITAEHEKSRKHLEAKLGGKR